MAVTGVRRVADLVVSPAPFPEQGGQIALSLLRILAGLIWLRNVVWKVPPEFGKPRGDGLYFWTNLAVEHPVFPPLSWLVEHVVLPNFTPFGWGVLVVETALAVLLLTGTAVKLAAMLGIAQSIAIGLSVAEAPNEWPWAYAMMIGIHAVLLLTPSARYAAVDAVRAAAPDALRPVARRLLGGWAIVLALIAVVAVVINPGRNRSFTVGIPDLEFSLGEYNLRGASVLLAIALAMVAAAVWGLRIVAGAAAAVSVAAAIWTYVQYGRTEVWLGGTTTTAAVFVSAAVVAVAAGHFRTDAIRKYPPEVQASVSLSVPLGRMGEPEEHAWLIALLASPLGGRFNGSVVTLDGARDNWFGPWPPADLTARTGEVPTEERRSR